MDENHQLLEDVSPPFMMPRLEVQPQLLSSELLPSHSSLVVEMNNSEYLPSSYATDELLGHDLTDEDRNLAAALVAVQLVQQQKHQQLQDLSASPNPNNSLASLVEKTEETMRTPVINSTYSLHDSDCDTRTTETSRIIKKSLPHKKRITRKLKKPVAIMKKMHRCSNCDQTFNTLEELTSHSHTCHISIVVPINQFACQICSLICNDQLTFFEHLKTHYEPTPTIASPPSAPSAFKLQPPENEGKTKESLLGSLLSLSPLNCIQCGKTFRRQKTFETHMRDFHPKIEDEFSEPEDLMEGIRCVVDRESAAEEDANDSKVWYAASAVTAAEHVCHLCGQVLTSSQEVCDHLNECKATLDPKIEQNSDSELKGRPRKKQRRKAGQLFCPHCDRVFSHRNSLMYHMRGHTGERPHQCDVCGKSFFAASALKVHMRLHSGDKPYKCEFCGRHFRQWGDLKYHCISIHSDQKQYQCEYCGKDFARKYSLIVHRRIHTGEKNYRCEFCGKTFRASSYLQNHRRIHTGEKPHPCEVCGKPFRVRSDMKRHLNTHSRRRGPGPTPGIGRTRTISTAAIKIQDSNSATESIVPDEELEEENTMVDEGNEDIEEEQPVEEEVGAAHESEDSIHYQRDPLETVRDGANTLFSNGHQLFICYPSELTSATRATIEAQWIQQTDA